jgi:hypothetical protein
MPSNKNPSRSFEGYTHHLILLKRISEAIWDKPDWYTAQSIIASRVMKGLWMFISYCEYCKDYDDDCYLVRRCYLNLSLIIEMFQKIINNSVKDKHKNNFHQQRQS